MRKQATNIIKSIFIFLNVCIIVLYLSVCLIPYIDTAKYWYIAIIGLVFPLIFFALIFFIIMWVLVRSRWCWISIIVLLLGLQQIIATFGFHFPKEFTAVKKENTLRVLQWNVRGWDEAGKETKGGTTYRPLMLDLIQKQHADVLCFEEFFRSQWLFAISIRVARYV